MGVKGGPDPDELFHTNARYLFDVLNQMGYVSTSSFINFLKSDEHTDWTTGTDILCLLLKYKENMTK